MKTITPKLSLQLVTFILSIFSVYAYASTDEEHAINQIFETHGKENLIELISKKRNGEITIEKNKSFLNIKGKPDHKFISAKSILQDLIAIKMQIGNLKTELDTHIAYKLKKQQEEEKVRLTNLASKKKSHDVSLSSELNQKLKITEYKYNETDSFYERRRLENEISILKTAYRRAKNNERSILRVYFPEEKPRKYINTSYCNNTRSKLSQLTKPDYRYQTFFCNDRVYRKQNPKSCGKYKYIRNYTLHEYKDEIRRLRQIEVNNCGS